MLPSGRVQTAAITGKAVGMYYLLQWILFAFYETIKKCSVLHVRIENYFISNSSLIDIIFHNAKDYEGIMTHQEMSLRLRLFAAGTKLSCVCQLRH